MTKLKNFFFILLLCLIAFYLGCKKAEQDYYNPTYTTQAQMTQRASRDKTLSDQKFEEICKRIEEEFSDNKDFITLFKQDKSEYYKTRLKYRDMILPLRQNDKTAYGTNYSIYSAFCLEDANSLKLEQYKQIIKSYIVYNNINFPQTKINAIFK